MEKINPMDIEKRSFEIITSELNGITLDEEKAPIIKRVIHTTADFEYINNMYFSEGAIEKAIEALKNGAAIVTDTNMAKSGINKAAVARLGCEVHCFMADEDVAKSAKEQGVTRAAVCMEKATELKKPVIIAVGNAPTALMRLDELINEGKINPEVIIGVPVGFVNVVESKELIINSGANAIIARGRKGGSNVAAAIVNALLYMASPREGI